MTTWEYASVITANDAQTARANSAEDAARAALATINTLAGRNGGAG